MSAFIVSDKTISYIVSYASIKGMDAFGKPVKGNEQQVGQALLDENYRSVNARYREDTTAAPFKFKMIYELSLAQFFKSIHCLNYQSCETKDWADTAACKTLVDFQLHATRHVVGYEQAKWD